MNGDLVNVLGGEEVFPMKQIYMDSLLELESSRSIDLFPELKTLCIHFVTELVFCCKVKYLLGCWS